jgi:ubiquinone/menaquinone biosynthesis C-methylase UbiE
VQYLYTCLALLLTSQLPAQLDADQRRILQGISAYRSELFNRNIVDRRFLGAVIQKQQKNGASLEDIKFSIQRLGYFSRLSPEQVSEGLAFAVQSDPLFQTLTDAEVAVILHNADLYDLMNENILNTTYPYIVSPNSLVFDELAFYRIRPGDHVAEIGAGNGEFSVILGVVYDSLEIFTNEIEAQKIEYINHKLSRITSMQPHTLITTVLGAITDPNLPEQYFDKIILRRSFHHFDDKTEMLRQIHADLKPTGELLIFEHVRNVFDKSNCYYAMTQSHILRWVKKENFEFVDSWSEGSYRCYRFRKRS